MKIGGVLITDDVRFAMMRAILSVEDHIDRKLTTAEIDMIIIEVVRRLSEPSAPTTRLQ